MKFDEIKVFDFIVSFENMVCFFSTGKCIFEGQLEPFICWFDKCYILCV